MYEEPTQRDDLRQELEALGKNLSQAFRSAWETPESRRLREEIITGLTELGTTLKREAEYLAESPLMQKARQSVEDISEQLHSPEVQQRLRLELIRALQTLNHELQSVIERWQNMPPSTSYSEESRESPPITQAPPIEGEQ